MYQTTDRNLRPRVSAGLLAGALSVWFIATGCDKGAAPQGAMSMPPPAVTTAMVVVRDVPEYLDQIGRTVASEAVTIEPQVSGQVIGIHFTDGAELKKDQLLFSLDPRPSQATLDQAKAALGQAQAALELAKSDMTRVSGLVDTGAITKQEYDQKKNAVDVAAAQVEAAKASIETSQVNLAYCTIHSPIDGRSGHRLVDAGNVVNAAGMGQGTQMLTIQKMSPIYADFTITENDLALVRKNMSEGTLKVYVRLPEDKDAGHEGALTFLDNTVQNAAGTVTLRATLSNEDRHFWPGQFVQARLVLTQIKSAVLVPQTAPQIGQQGHFVFVVHPDGTAEQRPVELGQGQGDQIVVTSGLNAGENVIIAGQLMVMNGIKVTAIPVAAPVETPAPQSPTTSPAGDSAQHADASERHAEGR